MKSLTSKTAKQLALVAAELQERKTDALRLFRPMKQQLKFFLDPAQERVLRGGNRCLPGWESLYDPVAKKWRRLDQTKEAFHVWSWDHKSGKQVIAKASVPFIKGHDYFYKTTLSNGKSFESTASHLVQAMCLGYEAVSECYEKGFPLVGEDGPIEIVSHEQTSVGPVWDITVEGTENYLHAGVYHHNSGKTTCAAVEFASAVTGIAIHDCDGNRLPFTYPTNKPLTTWVIGFDQNHIGKTIYRLLFMPGAFQIIRDAETNEWRAFRPNDPDDQERKHLCRQAPPLIPHRMIDPKGWAWEDKANRVFSVCRLKNGTEIRAFSSKGHAAMGDSVDLLWIDEDIEHPEHVREWEMRLPSVNGRLMWSAFPLSRNDALLALHERAEKEKHLEKPVVSETVIKFEDNSYIFKDQIDNRRNGMSDEEWRARNDGEFVIDSILMFPSFHIDIHGTPNREPELDNEIDAVIRKNHGRPPQDWTRYLIVDPGHTLAAVLFGAVAPPDKFGEVYYCYDELYLRMQSAEDMARAVRKRVDGAFEAFIMDWRAGRQTPMGYDTTIMEKYAKAFAGQGLKSRLSGSSFIWGSDDVEAGNESVREWLRVGENGRPRLIIARHLESMRYEFGRYRKMIVGNNIKEKQVDKDNHLMSCLRYWCASQPYYHIPVAERIKSTAELMKEQLESMFREANGPQGPIRLGVAV